MTDTGRFPDEGQPENAGALPGHPLSADGAAPADTGDPSAYSYLDHDVADEDDLLLMPGAQGAWSEQPAAPGGTHETGGRDTGSLDYTSVRAPAQAAAPAPPRRPLHLGPPVPEPNSGVVRSLADRGPAAPQQPVGSPVRPPAPPVGGVEYLDVPPADGVPHAEVSPVDAAPVEVPPVDVPPVAFVPPQHTADAVLAAHDIAAAGGPATAPDDGSAAASGVPGPRVPEPAPVMTVAPGAAQALVDRVAPTPPAGTPLGGVVPADGAGVAAEAPAEAASAEAVPVDVVAGAPSAEPSAEDVAPEQAPAPVDVPSVVDVPVDAAVPGDVPGDVPSAEAGTAPEPIPAGTQVGESVEEAAAAVADGAQSAEAAEPVAGGAPADVPSAAVPPQETAPAAPVEAVPGPAQQVTAPTVAEPAVPAPAPAQGVPAGVRGMGVMAFLDAPVPLAAVDAMPAPEAVTAAGGGQSVPAPVPAPAEAVAIAEGGATGAVQAAVAPVVEGAAAQASAVTAIEDAVPQAAVAIDGGVPAAGQTADVSLTDGTAPPAASAAGAGQPVPAQSDAAAGNASLPTADASATEGTAPQAAVPAVATEGSAADGGQSDTGVDGDAPATGDAASPAASAAGGEQPDAAVVTDIAGAPQVPAATAAPATGGEQSDAAAPQAAPEGTAPAQTGTVVADAPHAAGVEVETGVAVAVAAPAQSVSGAPQTADAAAPEAAAPVAEDEQPGADVAAPAQAATTVAAPPQAAPVAEGEQPAPDVAASEQAVAADAAAPPQTASEVAAPAQTQTVEAAAVAAVPQAAAPVAEDEQPMPDVAAPAQAGTPVADVPQSAEAVTDAAAPQAGAPVVEDESAADVAVLAQAGTAVAGAPQSAEVVAAAPQAAPAAEGEQAAPDVAAPAQSVPGAPQTVDATAPQAAAPVAEDEPVADVAAPAQAGTAVVGTPQSAEAEAETGAAVDAAAPQAAAAPAANGEQPASDDAPAVPATAGEPTDGTPQPPAGDPADGYAAAERAAVHRVMRERRDIRKGFRRDPVPPEVLLRVLEAAHTAPSVGHSQPWDFVVIRSAETRKTMHDLVARQREAYAKSLPKARAKQFKELKIEAILDTPVNIVVTADPTRGGRHTLGRHTQPQMAPYSSALAVENLWLAARAEGLGVGWVSFFDEREMVRALGLPEHLEVVAYLCVGYVDEFPDEPELMQAGWSKRRPLSWVVHEEEYGRRALPGEDPHDLLAETLRGIRPLDAKALGEAWERQKRMTKPSGALGMLEIISAQLCGLSRKCPPPIPEPAAVAIFAGDHGVHNQGVTAWPQEVTSQMVANFLGGGAVCNAFANQVGAEVCVVDVGVAGELPSTPGLLPRKIRPGTNDFTTGPAMTREEAMRALEVGIETARDLVTAGNKALLTGEMGIANTTVSAALIAVYTGADPAEITGRGTGINDEMHARKVDVVRRALELHQPDPKDPIGVLAAIGGLEHAAMVGLILGGASLRTPVILDGVSAGAAALVARAIAPEALAACIAGHRSAEPGHVAALTKLGLRPLVDLDLRLGEGTGALLALPVVQSAARAMHEVATFDTAGVSEKG